MTRTRISEQLHTAVLEHSGLSDVLLASILSATLTIDDLGPDPRRHYWLSILGTDCVTEFKRLLESLEAAARAVGDIDRTNDCRNALEVFQIAQALQS